MSLKRIGVIILGAPGSGKGTISTRIVKNFGLTHISSGDILRDNVLKQTPLGKDAKSYMDRGQLVPDHVMIDLIMNEVLKTNNSWLLDGFPRTLKQAEILSSKTTVDAAINLIVPFDVIIDRIQKRWVHQGSGRVYNTDFNAPKVPGLDDITGEKLVQREDDKPTAVAQRLQIYSETLGPVIQFFKAKGILVEFKGKKTDHIWPSVQKYLTSRLEKD